MKIYVERVQLSNYRSCKKTTLDLNRNLSALIGANGSGKSNVLNGILLLKKMARNLRPRIEEDEFLSSCKLSAIFNLDGKSLSYEAAINFTTSERNVDEVATSKEKWNFKEITGEDKWFSLPTSIIYDYFRISKINELSSSIRDRDHEMLLSLLAKRYGSELSENVDWEIILTTIEKVNNFVDDISYYSASKFTDPSQCPTSFELENNRLARRIVRPREGHVQFMYDLYLSYRDNKDEFSEFLSLVGPDGIKLVDGIAYDEIEVPSSSYQVVTGGRVIHKEIKKLLVIPNIVIRGEKFSPNQLSEGTFKTLAVLFYIMTDKSQLLLLEEPEVCVHHGLLSSIIEIIKEYSKDKQIIISTHSDFILDSLDPTNVFVVKNDTDKGTVVKHMPKSMPISDYRALKDYLNNVGNLGEYWRHGELGE